MGTLLRKLFDIREGEGFRASLMFVYIFLIIASLLIIKPVRNSLFLTHLGVTQLPYAFMLVAGSAAIIISLYSKYSSKIQLNRIMLYTTLLAVAFLLVFYLLLYLNYQASWFYYAFYVWVAIFGVLSTSNFWLLANYVFNAREAKRLFGFIGAGAIAGGIFGGYLTNFLAPIIGTKNMIFFCIGFLFCCILILTEVWRKWARHNYIERIHRERKVAERYSDESTLKSILNSKHLKYMAGVIGVGVIVANLVDYQFNAVASEVITSEDRLTAFFGFWLSNLSIASLCVQLFLTGRILKTFGVLISLFFLPIGIFIGAIGILVNPALLSAVLIKVSDGGFKHSIHKAGLELLSLPIPSRVKNRAKAFIDVFVDSAATGCGGLLLIAFSNYLGVSIQYISFIIIGLIASWFYLIVRVRNEYIDSFRHALEKRSIDLEDQTVNVKDASVVECLARVFEGKNERQTLYALHLIENVKNEAFIPYLKELISSPSPDVKVQLLRIMSKYEDIDFSPEIEKLIQDDDFDVKVEAMCYTMRHSPEGRKKVLELLSDSDLTMRSAAFLCMAYEYRDNKDFREKIDAQDVFHRFVDESYRLDLQENEFNFLKSNIAKVIGVLKIPDLYPFLTNLLRDDSPEVVRAAMSSAGSTRDPVFVSILIEHLNTPLVRLQARDVLKNYGEEIIDILEEYLGNTSEEMRIRVGISRVLALIGSQKSVNVLAKHFGESDLQLRYELVKALNKLNERIPNFKLDKQFLRSHIMDAIKQYYQIIGLLHHQRILQQSEYDIRSSDEDRDRIQMVHKLLLKALEEKLGIYLKLIFRLLGLRYPSQDIYDAYLGVVSNKSDLQASAVEFLDNILDPNLKRVVIPIVEGTSPNVLKHRIQQILDFELLTEHEGLEFLLRGGDNWLKVCALYLIAEKRREDFNDEISKLINESDPMVKETVEYCLARIATSE